MKKIDNAIAFAERKHNGQLDDEGKDFFTAHPYKVGLAVKQLTDNEDIICSAFLHDTLEDTNTTYEELEKEFGKKVADLVNELTHEGKPDNYGFYFPRLKSKEAIMIKLIDRASNVSRMGGWSKKRKEQYLKNTRFWRYFSNKGKNE